MRLRGSRLDRMRQLILVLGDQLTLNHPAFADLDPQQDLIVMAEVVEESTHVWSHPQRITLFLSAMRHFAQSLTQAGFRLRYLALDSHAYASLSEAWQAVIDEDRPQSITVCEPGDWRVLQAIRQCAEHNALPLKVLPDNHFLCSSQQFQQWAGKYQSNSLRMEFFYREMRKRYVVLMDGDQPVGGTWNYDHDNRQSIDQRGPQDLIPAMPFAPDAITQQVMQLVKTRFADHPGNLEAFAWPVTREAALVLLEHFVTHKLKQFGPYQDAMWQDQPFLWHSLLASSLNLKLLHPREVIAAAEAAYQAGEAPLASVEGFIRQILGWREFIRGMYWLDMPGMKQANFLNHQQALPTWFWTGNTQMRCLAQTIQQTLETGYAHHIQRLMVTGLFATLAELSPQQVADWYLAVYVDAVEWVELPNVAGMALFANGGRFTSKPYVASGAYIERMSNYCGSCRYRPKLKTGEQACPFTTLYWAFLIKHEAMLAANPRTSLMVKHVAKMDEPTREAIITFAKQRLASVNSL